MLSRAPATQFTRTSRFRSELAALLLLAIPVVLSELGWMAMSIVDTIMVGRLSPAAIGAVGHQQRHLLHSRAVRHRPAPGPRYPGRPGVRARRLRRLPSGPRPGRLSGDRVYPHRHAHGGLRTPSVSAAGHYRNRTRACQGIHPAAELERSPFAHLRRFPALPARGRQSKAGDLCSDLRQPGQLVRQLGAHLRQAGTSRHGRPRIGAFHLRGPRVYGCRAGLVGMEA